MNKKEDSCDETIQIFCRIRPLPINEKDYVKIIDDHNLILLIPQFSSTNFRENIQKLSCSFNQIFDETSSQKELFEQICLPMVQDLLLGKNGLLFTHGLSETGKTYTIFGDQHEIGLLQMSLDTLFNSISFQQAKKYVFKPDKMNSFEIQTDAEASIERKRTLDFFKNKKPNNKNIDPKGKILNVNEDNIYAVFISCIEIYNNDIYDLLDDFGHQQNGINQNNNNLYPASSNDLKEDKKGEMYIKDVNEIEVKTTEEALELMLRAQKKRVAGSTDLNSESSRSHCIFTIRVVQSSYDPSKNDDMNVHYNNKSNVHASQLSFIDLAVSEKTIKRTKSAGLKTKEAGSINSSLMALRNCMEALRENITNGTKKMIPYRDSKLTLLFKNYFQGNGKIKMILCINPSSIEFDENIKVLKFSNITKKISSTQKVIKPKKTESFNDTEKFYSETLEKANLPSLAGLQKNNFSLINENVPPLDVLSPDDDETIKKLINYLEELQGKRNAIINETDTLKHLYYLKLRQINDEMDKLKEERNEFKCLLEKKEEDVSKFISKIKILENIIKNKNSTSSELESKTSLKSVDKEQENQLNMSPKFQTVPQQLPQSPFKKMKNTLTKHFSQQISCPVELANLNEIRPTSPSLRIKGILSVKKHKNIEKDRDSLNRNENIIIPIQSTFKKSSRITQTTTTHAIGARYDYKELTGNFSRPSSPQPNKLETNSSLTTVSHPIKIEQKQTSIKYSSRSNFETDKNNNQRCESPILLRNGIPVANRRGRRSKSFETWLDHRPYSLTKLEAVFQPQMRRKKSVARIEFDDAKHASKYLLTHQQQDDEGEIVTNLIKGDILRSPTGGANVIFTEIETLKIKSNEIPKPIKRIEIDEDMIERRLRTEERCSIGFDCNDFNDNNSYSINRNYYSPKNNSQIR